MFGPLIRNKGQQMENELESVLKRMQSEGVRVERIKVREGQIFTLTAGELRACCDKNPNHPHTAIFRNAVAGHGPNEEVAVDRVDLEALLENKQVVLQPEQTEEVIVGSSALVTTERKVLAQ